MPLDIEWLHTLHPHPHQSFCRYICAMKFLQLNSFAAYFMLLKFARSIFTIHMWLFRGMFLI